MVLLPVGELVWMRGGWLPLNTSLLKEKQKTPLDDSGRAGDQPVGRAAMAAAAEPPGQRLHFLKAFFEVDPT